MFLPLKSFQLVRFNPTGRVYRLTHTTIAERNSGFQLVRFNPTDRGVNFPRLPVRESIDGFQLVRFNPTGREDYYFRKTRNSMTTVSN